MRYRRLFWVVDEQHAQYNGQITLSQVKKCYIIKQFGKKNAKILKTSSPHREGVGLPFFSCLQHVKCITSMQKYLSYLKCMHINFLDERGPNGFLKVQASRLNNQLHMDKSNINTEIRCTRLNGGLRMWVGLWVET